MKANEEKKTANVKFAAIDQYITRNIITPEEKETKSGGREMMTWGENNDYPLYLLDLYNNVATLRSIIDGCVDFVTGNDVEPKRTLYDGAMNKTGDSARDIVRLCAASFYHYGGFALQVIRNAVGEVAEIYPLDLRYLRMNKDGNVFYYCEDFGKRYTRSNNVIVYPAFMPNANHPASVLYVKNTDTQVYPAPLYAASVKSCEVERAIDTYHLNAIKNGFHSSLFVNFNAGDPGDEIKDEIEKNFVEKFCSEDNAGRVGFSWNTNKDSATTFESLKVDDFADQYTALSKHCRQQIFTAFRANPNLFGIPTESLGFSAEEYKSSFALFNRTEIIPVQQMIVDAFDYVLDMEDSIAIEPFTLMDDEEQTLADRVEIDKLIAIVTDARLNEVQKRNILTTAYGLTDEEAASFLA